MSILAWRGGGRVRGRGSGLIEGAHKPRPDLESICEALLRPSSQPTTSSRSFWPGKCQTCTLEACGLIRGRPCRWRSRLRRLGQSRRLQGAVNTLSEDIGGKSARLLERHRQVEAFVPWDAAIAQRSPVSRRTRWSCDLEVWVRNVGRLAPSTFPPTEAGGLAHLGSRRLPRMRSLADEITAAATRKRCTGVQDEGACARRQRMH